jgi:hypothetical protein
MTAAAVEAHRPAMLDDLQAVAVKLGFVQPVVAGGHALGRHRAAGLDEAEGRDHRTQLAGFPLELFDGSPLAIKQFDFPVAQRCNGLSILGTCLLL